MTEIEVGGGMYDTVRKHGEALSNHDERLTNLEEADRRHEEQMAEIKANSLSFENTIMKESRETQDVVKRLETTIVDQNEKLYIIVNNAMGIQAQRENNTMSIQAQREKNEHDQKMAKINAWANVFLKVLGGLSVAGGIGYLIVQHFLNQLGGN